MTNSADGCLKSEGTTNAQAVARTYSVDHQDWNGVDGHSALLTAHTSPVRSPGYPILAALDNVLAHGTTSSDSFYPKALVPSSARIARGLASLDAATGSLSGTLRGPATGTLQDGGQIVLVGDLLQRYVSVDADGSFTFAGVPTGDYRIWVEPLAHGWTGRWVGGDSAATATVFSVNGAVDAGSVSGTPPVTTQVVVTTNGAEPVPDALAALSDESGNLIAFGQANSAGELELTAPPGDYHLIAGAPTLKAKAQSVTLTATRSIAVDLDPGAVVTVELRDADGNALADALAALYDGDTLVATAMTDRNGQARFIVDPGEYSVRLFDPADRATMPTDSIRVSPILGDPGAGFIEYQAGQPGSGTSDAPVIFEAAPPTTVALGDNLDYTFGVRSTEPATFQITSGELPAGVSLGADGRLSGSPTATGEFKYSVTASNSFGSTQAGPFQLLVTDPPAIISGSPPATAQVGAPYAFEVRATGYPVPALGVSGDLPPGIVLDTDGRLIGSPTKPGTFTFTVTADSPAGHTSAGPYTIDVVPADSQPGAGVPSAPGSVSAIGGDRRATISWEVPASDGGSAITGYEITPFVDGLPTKPINVGTALLHTVTGLTNGMRYTFAVAAVNASGRGVAEFSPVVIPSVGTALTITSASKIVRAGRPIKVKGRLVQEATGKPVVGALIGLEYRRRGRTGSYTAHSPLARTNARGKVTIRTFAPTTAVEVRLVYEGSDEFAPSVSTPKVVKCRKIVRVKVIRVAKGSHRFLVAGSIAPSSPGQTVRLQRWSGSEWVTIKKRTVGKHSSYRFSIRSVVRGTLKMRVHLTATPGYLSANSATRRVRIG